MKLKDDAPVKYHVRAHRVCGAYPDNMDVVFDVAEFIMSSNKRKKSWKAEDMKIAFDDLKKIFPDMGDEKFKERVKTILADLHKNEDIAFSNGDVILTEKSLSKIYQL